VHLASNLCSCGAWLFMVVLHVVIISHNCVKLKLKCSTKTIKKIKEHSIRELLSNILGALGLNVLLRPLCNHRDIN
jgi:hypothetical protein